MSRVKAELLQALERLSAPPAPPPTPPDAGGGNSAAYIALSVAPPEHGTLSQAIMSTLEQANVFAAIQTSDNLALEEIFLKEDGLLTVFGDEPYDRIQQILMTWRKLLAKHRRPLGSTPPVGIYLAQPPPADKRRAINMTLPGLRLVEWNDAAALQKFVTEIQQFAASRSS